MNIGRISKSLKVFLSKHWRKWTILAILAMVIYIGFVAYEYVYKPIYQFKEVTAQRLGIKRQIYQQIMDFYSKSQQDVNDILNKNYPDPFK
ncbi:MAG: hypothetical protein A2V69_02775 [Candidatus Portnoybacteria bacterium RBG_13_40_8]|uniref:Uncharacterized protein n=1 Tax=Candidatus Portnoybacteria bacterium RBG_13_40_8 TaxID=1801990 RepID=A0A1G2F5P7_9BACT|nr:MAG: hypothetical protein A2V69_02775 [Candidatus Portnoybacteria bacterium RBG_13_40_8]